jgi:hypothetical protein
MQNTCNIMIIKGSALDSRLFLKLGQEQTPLISWGDLFIDIQPGNPYISFPKKGLLINLRVQSSRNLLKLLYRQFPPFAKGVRGDFAITC